MFNLTWEFLKRYVISCELLFALAGMKIGAVL